MKNENSMKEDEFANVIMLSKISKKESELNTGNGDFDDAIELLIKKFLELRAENTSLSLNDLLYLIEKMTIDHVLTKTMGHQRRTAEILNLKPTTLSEKIKKYNISVRQKKYQFLISTQVDNIFT